MSDTPNTPDTEEAPVVVDEFSESFAKFSDPELPVLKPETASAEVPVAEGEETAEESAGESAEESAEETAAEPAEVPVAEGEEAAAEPEKPDAELIAKLEKLLDKRAAEPAPVAQAQEQAQEPAPKAEPYTAEELAFLEEYEKDWSDVSKAEALKRRTEYNELVQYVFNEVAAVLRPMTQELQAVLQDRHQAQLRGAVPEFDTLQESLAAWADSQPTYLRETYQRVIQGGKPDEIADLVDRYKKDTSVVDSSKQTATELPPPAKKAAQALAPVSSKRSSVVATEPDKNDFDSAFAKFAATT